MPPNRLIVCWGGGIAPGVVCEALPNAKAFAGLEFVPPLCPAVGVLPKRLKRLGLATPPAAAPEANAVAGAAQCTGCVERTSVTRPYLCWTCPASENILSTGLFGSAQALSVHDR